MTDPRCAQHSELVISLDTSRLQGFSDAVFALAATLLVVTLQVPDSYEALLGAVAGFPAFAIAFAAIASVWWQHRQFFAAYPIMDGWIAGLNSLLLFIVLLYVYPLKLLTEVVAELFFGVAPNVTLGMGPVEIRGLYLVFGAAVVGLVGVFTAMHVRAWHLRHELGLNELARFELRQKMLFFGAQVLVGGLSMTLAALSLGLRWGLPALVYLLPFAVGFVQNLLTNGRRQALEAARR